MSTSENQRLVGAPSQTAVDMQPPGTRPTRAYKVVGITVLACALIAGQAAIAYFLVSQRGDIKALQEQTERLRVDLTKARSVSVPMRVQMPMNTLTADLVDAEASSETTQKAGQTKCQQQRAGLKPLVPGFYPKCDEQGLYQAQQCFIGACWCVSPLTGNEIPGTMRNGPVSCGTTGIVRPAPILDITE